MNGELTARILFYEQELEKFEARMQATKPKRDSFETDREFYAAYAEWQMILSCDRPNKPGYERANND